MKESNAKVQKLSEYQKPDFNILTTDLIFQLEPSKTKVLSRLKVKKNPEAKTNKLALDGINLKLITVKMNDRSLKEGADYTLDENALVVLNCPDEFELYTEVEINPEGNKALEGLYLSNDIFCTQCEAEGFRKITYYLDRPDCLSIFTTTIEADPKKYPILLSNGNLTETSKTDKGYVRNTWNDPHKKPSYLFALVAGDLDKKTATFTTQSKRKVDIELYCKSNNLHKIDFAIESVINSMKWDEQNYGREYDLDRFMVVAVDDFNSGAMENKGLNIFNSRLIMADPKTATDDDYERIEAVVGHEYFHNWSGNRVTCRDWFQLSLKEGFTVFREQQFSSDMGSESICRIDSVNFLRNIQFLEDNGPLSHPVRPESYEEINNFYTPTVYEKGSEVIRMLYSIIGPENFRKGSDLYFERFDGQAVTCDDFVACMQEVSKVDLTNFKKWYSQSGTPVLQITTDYDSSQQSFNVKTKQINKPTADQPNKEPLHLPVKTALFYENGDRHSFDGNKNEIYLDIAKEEQSFEIKGVKEKPILSILRSFSAPVYLEYQQTDEHLSFLAQKDNDGFNRWESMQKLVLNFISASLKKPSALAKGQPIYQALAANLDINSEEYALVARLLTPPKTSYIISLLDKVDLDALTKVLAGYEKDVGETFKEVLASNLQKIAELKANGYAYNIKDAGLRSLEHICTLFLAATKQPEFEELLVKKFFDSQNMTDEYAYLIQILHHKLQDADKALEHFHKKWGQDSLVMNKWFVAQGSHLALDKVQKLLEHPSFDMKNPNKVYSLVGGFIQQNQEELHRHDGRGYEFASDIILKIDSFNPQVASRLIKGFSNLEKFDVHRQDLLSQMFQKMNQANTSKNLGELVSKFDQMLTK